MSASVDWDYLNQGYVAVAKQYGINWKVTIPATGHFASYYCMAIAKDDPYPAAARLWEEFLYSPEGQNLWLEGFTRPVLLSYMIKHGTVNQKALKALPKASGKAPFLTPSLAQVNAAKAVVAKEWGS
jgi:putative spermidine/putrescine transport system substrate-binding protein